MIENKIVLEILRGLLFALPMAAGFLLLLRMNAPARYFLVLGMLPVCLPLWLCSNLRIYGYHGLMQAGYVYEILNGNIPPHNPLFAGAPLLYPWGYAFLVASVSRLLDISPFYSTALLSTVALAGIMVVTFKISRLFTTDFAANLFATMIPLYAFTFTQDKNLMQLFRWGADPSHLFGFGEGRSMPIMEKFIGDTGFPFGFFLYGLFLYFFLCSITAKTWNWRQACVVGLLIIGVGFAYPFFLPSAACGGFAACMVVAYRNRYDNWRQSVMVSVALVVGSALLLMYLIPISHGKYEAGRLLLDLSWPRWERNIGVLILTCAPIWILLAIYYRRLWEILRKHRTATMAVVISAFVSYCLFLAVKAPFASEYKFLSQAIYLTGILGGWTFSWIRERRPVLTFILLVLFLLPMGTDVGEKSLRWTGTTRYAERYENGLNIDSKDPAEHTLYAWIQQNTDANAVFLDSSLDVTVYGRRELYVGMPTGYPKNGFGMRSQEILAKDNGYDPRLIEQRQKILLNVLEGKQPLVANELEPVVKSFPHERIFIIARTENQRQRLRACSILNEVFENDIASVFSIVRTSQESFLPAISRPFAEEQGVKAWRRG